MTKQRPLTLENFIPYRLSVASNLVSDVISSAYRSLFGLTVPEWRLVTVLADREQASQIELGAATRMDKVTVSRAAIALVNRGLVVRASNPRDKRSHLLCLSPSGNQLYGEVAPKALALERELLSTFSAEERKSLAAMLVRLEQAAMQVSGQAVSNA